MTYESIQLIIIREKQIKSVPKNIPSWLPDHNNFREEGNILKTKNLNVMNNSKCAPVCYRTATILFPYSILSETKVGNHINHRLCP